MHSSLEKNGHSQNPLDDFLREYSKETSSDTATFIKLKQLHEYLCDPATADHIALTGTQVEYTEKLEDLMDKLAREAFDLHEPRVDGLPFSTQVIQHTILSVIDSLCDEPNLRSHFAQKWLSPALAYVQSCVECDERDNPGNDRTQRSSETPYFITRACCAILVNIAKSKEVHPYFVDLSALARCIRYSSDIYLQLQCCEVLFCVSRSNTEALGTATELIGAHTMDCIERTKATPRFLFELCEVIQRVPSRWEMDVDKPGTNNSSRCVISISEVVLPPLLHHDGISTDASLWYRHSAHDGGLMHAFFGKKMLVLDWAYEPELTIPYTAIKAIKLNRNKQLVIRLREIPFSLRAIYEEMAMRVEKSGSVPTHEIVRITDVRGFPILLSVINASNHSINTSGSQPRPEQRVCPEIILNTTHEEYKKMRDSNIHKWIAGEMAAAKKAEVQPEESLMSQFTNTQESMNTQTVEIAASSHAHLGDPIAPEAGSYPGDDTDHQPIATPDEPFKSIFEPNWSSRLSSHVNVSAYGRPMEFVSHANPQRMPSYSDEIDPLLQELKCVVTQKVSMRHQEGQAILQEAEHRIQQEIQELRKRCEERYTKANDKLQTQISTMRKAQKDVQAKMGALIDKLNTDVRSMADQSKIVQDQFTVMGLEGVQSIEELRKHQADQIAVMNQTVEVNLRALTEKIHAAVSSTNPLRFMTQFLSQSGNDMSASQQNSQFGEAKRYQ